LSTGTILAHFFEDNKAVLSFHPSGNERILPLLSMNIPRASSYKSIIKAFESASRERLIGEGKME